VIAQRPTVWDAAPPGARGQKASLSRYNLAGAVQPGGYGKPFSWRA